MLIPFRQGIIKYLNPGTTDFLMISPTFVSLNIGDNPMILTFASGNVDYLFLETLSISNAWSIITSPPSLDQWLYWDINSLTAVRTFGVTKYAPVVQFSAPGSPAIDQHWFDLSTRLMKVWSGLRWIEKIRVFACKLDNAAVPISVSIDAPLFSGTQVGLNVSTSAGTILFDVATQKPLRTADNKFLTGETKLQATTGAQSGIKVEAVIVEAEAQQHMPGYTIVKFTDFGKVFAADHFVASSGVQFGIIETEANIGDIIMVTTSGVIANPDWNWEAVNLPLFSDDYGQLVTIPPAGSTAPVGIIIDRNKILLYASLSISALMNSVVASSTQLGSVELSVPAVMPDIPIVVGNNDPRIVNAVQRTGDTMTGPLTLNGDPTLPLGAATKQYVDALGSNTLFFSKINEEVITITKGTPVYQSSTGHIKRGQANNITTTNIIGLVSSTSILGSTIGPIQTGEILNALTTQWDMITGGVGGLIEGTEYYLDPGLPGQITPTPPSATGQYIVSIGIALSTTDLSINIQQYMLL